MGSLPPRARLFAALVTAQVLFGLVAVATPAVSGATTSTATAVTQPSAAGPVHRSLVQGTNGDDTIITKRRAQEVYGLAGNDYIRLGGGNDVAYGEDGDDYLHGNDGTDVVHGGPGNDHPQGGPGDDRVYGEDGDDELDGDQGNDFIDAGPGNDEVTGDEGDDVIYPGDGADTIYGEEGDNTVIATNDGVRDDIFCNMIKVATPPGTIIYIGEVDPLDALRNCKVVIQ
jgi:Ca2+-binding RTX toxin-like protein